LRIARWYCPKGHRTFSLLPDLLAARMPGLLASVDAAVATAASAESLEAALDTMREFDTALAAPNESGLFRPWLLAHLVW